MMTFVNNQIIINSPLRDMETSKKWCFVAREVKGGWRLKLAYGSKDYAVRGVVFKKMEEIEQLTHDGKVVFVHLKDSKYPVK